MKTVVIIPTYNERLNILPIINEVLALCSDVDILVVDDNSPDGTGRIVLEIQFQNPQVKLLERKAKEGLGAAYKEGFKWALANNYDYIIQMDADFSHRPQDLSKIRKGLEKHDYAVGSRWVPGGEVVNWEWYRKLISRVGNLYARILLSRRISDWTGGFNGWRRTVLEKIPLAQLQSQGYSFQIEMKYQALRLNFSPIEVPIVFEERREGLSKMSMSIILEALKQVWRMRV